jgi:hypothetical protein
VDLLFHPILFIKNSQIQARGFNASIGLSLILLNFARSKIEVYKSK